MLFSQMKRAFTLIELLAVIAVIGVLMAILIPVIAGVRARAHNVECVSNLRQIGTALGLYTGDHGFELVYNASGGNVTWVQSLGPYVGDLEKEDLIGWNPRPDELDVRPKSIWACPESSLLTKQGSYSDYAINTMINESPTTLVPPPRKNSRLQTLQEPAKLIAIGDAKPSEDSEYCTRGLGPWISYNNSGLDGRHDGMANVLFWDFHVEAIDPTTMPANSYETQHNPPWVDAL
ncbi:prepilin-type N-terminal cleavage/methylation domain-containing protein [Coraliomargarita algicola]|uniref:Prepilin-type N-terminal cleavage/methylation domain-containing protein n=1 Tax=Coraliomargarita algicola TaxID=3092156 RepID=A0ABZ0RHC1_9BACT|nr:prepilin-type N-terminal cleavage/methylation domain-containing protein [Coraliomargarita sp. J2-16]WPJ95580.1 prepilin-type N-terminal cleavage/methylation domain-containing protein [Coraliomargarita sp. J2-16]